MKATRLSGYGAPPVLDEVADPKPGRNEVLVRVAGAAVNPLDLKIAAGYLRDFFPVEFPYTLGTDVAGSVVEVGADVGDRAVGDAVVARLDPSTGGAFAELAVVPADQIVPAPTTIPLSLAAGAVTSAATALQALTEVAGVRPGHTVLVHAGAGGVGSFAVQIARRLGARVVTTVSKAGADLAAELGAHQVIDYREQDFGSAVADVDVVIDTVGGAVEARSLDVLRPGGLLVAVSGPPEVERAAARGLRAEFVFHASDATRLARVMSLIDDGLRVAVDSRYALDHAAAALEYLTDGHAKGKVILTAGSVG
ncbi:NADP-dependent oxidoreductase [Amycolatopsis sp. 195334CR]|uniref:NADP-dependent oxidoreductase n=1 Tax=Amycolatopsis sp. 195334CR TaxID=2814588 RepID=UPI001A8ED73F|nr:NADP-dependent oxidoreductase [Amycolatopsis sp. 195334CR]MBN6040412.1 NADP-dependent oxidoreductase [Amycolatopsis sp. 195334CR]